MSLRARLERERCEACGKAAHTVPVRYPWQYFAGTAVVLGGALFLLLPQVDPAFPWGALVETFPLRLLWLAVIITAGFFLANWGLRLMKESAATRGEEMYPGAEP